VNFTKRNQWFEHDAECRALRALPGALRTLRYSRSMVEAATSRFRDIVRGEPAPYGGAC
jgi:hypothetical protein